ncbi:MAG: phenylacetate--CoA ligase [Euryarchaeota archaeon]|nr:phenylacetate--CoA ligase [Euryarchaeota archaeon]
MAYLDKHIETMSREDLEKTQYRLLKTQVTRLYSSSPFYRARMREANISPEDIRCIQDITKLPFIHKQDLRDNYPEGMLSVPRRDLVRFHASSGTTGKPTIVCYTKNDIDTWTTSLARGLISAGLGPDDVIQVSNTYGLFSGGLGFHYAGERIGAAVVPASTGNTERQIELIQDLEVTAMAATPSYMLHLGEVAEKMGVSIKNDTKLKIGLLGGEPWSVKMRDRICEWLGVKGINCYGSSEMYGPMFTECSEQDGIHIWGDIAYAEILDQKTGEQVAPGERGELVLTMLQKEALPMIRYRVGDITEMDTEPCACGRTHPRLKRIFGRVDDMLIVRGINVFPSQVEHTLMSIPEVGDHFEIIVDRKGALDTMLIRVELKKEAFTDNIVQLMELREKIAYRLRGALNIGAAVELVEPDTLQRFEGKARRVIDRRDI